MGSFKTRRAPHAPSTNFLCGKNAGVEAKNRRENITIRSSPYCDGERLAAPQAQP
jgi:hypothetical protein